ncbi:MAG: transposase [Deltaproteobacteria bacterium]|nr:transposase [Deltaproteobacteria bacterium]
MNRGLRHLPIALDSEDRKVFLATVGEAVEKYSVNVHAFALLDNHYHLLMETPLPNLHQTMRYIDSVYSRRFNRRHSLDGPLFRGRYKSRVVETETYLLTLITYIHLNATEAGIEQQPSHPDRSSHCAYLGGEFPPWITTQFLLSHFSSRRDYEDYILGLPGKHALRENSAIFETSRWKAILGSDAFVEDIMSRTGMERPRRDHPGVRQVLTNTRSPERVVAATAKIVGITAEELVRRSRSTTIVDAQSVASEILVRHAGFPQAQVGKILGGWSHTSIARMISRVEKQEELSKMRDRVLGVLKNVQCAN